jgi:hypothetical protein
LVKRVNPRRKSTPKPTAEADVTAKDAKGVAALQMRLSFDGGSFTVESVRPGPLLANAMLEFLPGEGVCTVAFASAEAIKEDGVLLVVSLLRKEGAEQGTEIGPPKSPARLRGFFKQI